MTYGALLRLSSQLSFANMSVANKLGIERRAKIVPRP